MAFSGRRLYLCEWSFAQGNDAAPRTPEGQSLLAIKRRLRYMAGLRAACTKHWLYPALAKMKSSIHMDDNADWRPTRAAAMVHLVVPAGLLGAFTLGLAVPPSRAVFLWLLREGNPVELLTFVAFLAAGILSILLGRRLRRRDATAWLTVFYVVLGLGFVVVAGEEVSWGQTFLGFATPEAIDRINAQGELTLHNLKAIQGHSEYFRVLFVVAGSGALLLNRTPRLRAISTPLVLWPWYSVMALHVSFDLLNDTGIFPSDVYWGIRWTSELVEMMCGLTALLYVWLNTSRINQAAVDRSTGAEPVGQPRVEGGPNL